MSSQKNDDPESLDNISKKLKFVIEKMGIKQSHMAEKLGLSPSGLHYILNNNVGFTKGAKKLADYLNVNENWLLTGDGEIHRENISISTYKYPLYYPDQLKIYYSTKQKTELQTDNYAISTVDYSRPILGIYVTDTNFSPKFEIGDIILFEEIKKLKDGEIILIYLVKTNEIAIKYGFYANKTIILFSNNEEPIKIPYNDENIVILGGYRECYKKVK